MKEDDGRKTQIAGQNDEDYKHKPQPRGMSPEEYFWTLNRKERRKMVAEIKQRAKREGVK